MSNFNKVIMVGNLTRDPEYKQIGGNQTLCRLGIASNRQYKNRQTGGVVQEVCFVDVDVWGPQAESCNQYLKKGKSILVEGRLKLDQWKDVEGQSRSKHSIVADRVVFLNTGSGDDLDYSQDSNVDRDIVEKLNDIKKSKESTIKDANSVIGSIMGSPESKRKKRESSTDNNSLPEIEFKDEAPFSDDLPF